MTLLTRRLAALAAVPVLLCLAAPPASAASGGVAFEGTAHIDCFGCGSSLGTASLFVTGAISGGAVSGSAYANYTASAGPSVHCMVGGMADGNVTGAINVAFFWTRVGAVAVITTSGDINGAGTAAFAVTTLGVPCGGSADAILVGTVAGV